MQGLLAKLGIGPLAESYMELRKAKITAEIDRFQAGLDAEAQWEANAAQNAATSWLDEWWTVILSIPLIMAFVPWLAPYVDAGFQALSAVPEWYVWGVLASISFAFARRTLPSVTSWWKGRSG